MTPIRGYLNCDSQMTIYADGDIIAKSNTVNQAEYVELEHDAKVLGIKVCINLALCFT